MWLRSGHALANWQPGQAMPLALRLSFSLQNWGRWSVQWSFLFPCIRGCPEAPACALGFLRIPAVTCRQPQTFTPVQSCKSATPLPPCPQGWPAHPSHLRDCGTVT